MGNGSFPPILLMGQHLGTYRGPLSPVLESLAKKVNLSSCWLRAQQNHTGDEPNIEISLLLEIFVSVQVKPIDTTI